jgi:hypothetical protein
MKLITTTDSYRQGALLEAAPVEAMCHDRGRVLSIAWLCVPAFGTTTNGHGNAFGTKMHSQRTRPT